MFQDYPSESNPEWCDSGDGGKFRWLPCNDDDIQQQSSSSANGHRSVSSRM